MKDLRVEMEEFLYEKRIKYKTKAGYDLFYYCRKRID